MNEQTIPGGDSGTRKYRRQVRNIIIHKPIQREFMFVVIILFMISMLAVGFIIHYTIREAAFGGGFRFGKINPYEVLSDVSYQLILWVSCILFATLLVIGSFGIFFLHRIAGPVYRFRVTLRRVNHGHAAPPIRLREGDYFTEVAGELNTMIQTIQDQRVRLKQVEESLDHMTRVQDPQALQRNVLELKASLQKSHEAGHSGQPQGA